MRRAERIEPSASCSISVGRPIRWNTTGRSRPSSYRSDLGDISCLAASIAKILGPMVPVSSFLQVAPSSADPGTAGDTVCDFPSHRKPWCECRDSNPDRLFYRNLNATSSGYTLCERQ
jgi:hypothetical protein